MINLILVSLSENDKRLIFALVIIFVLVLVLVGYLGYLLNKLMRWQGKKTDTLIHDVVYYRVITDKKSLIKYGRKKNWALFFKQAYIPVIITLVGAIVLIIRNAISDDWGYNPFNSQNGLGTIFWTWKFSGELTGDTYSWIRFNKLVVDNTPHLVASGWAGYISAPCFIVSIIWYFFASSSFLARTVKLYARSKQVFEKSLDGFNQNQTEAKETEENKEQE